MGVVAQGKKPLNNYAGCLLNYVNTIFPFRVLLTCEVELSLDRNPVTESSGDGELPMTSVLVSCCRLFILS